MKFLSILGAAVAAAVGAATAASRKEIARYRDIRKM